MSLFGLFCLLFSPRRKKWKKWQNNQGKSWFIFNFFRDEKKLKSVSRPLRVYDWLFDLVTFWLSKVKKWHSKPFQLIWLVEQVIFRAIFGPFWPKNKDLPWFSSKMTQKSWKCRHFHVFGSFLMKIKVGLCFSAKMGQKCPQYESFWGVHLFTPDTRAEIRLKMATIPEMKGQKPHLDLCTSKAIHDFLVKSSYSNHWGSTIKSILPTALKGLTSVTFFRYCGRSFWIA